MDITELYQLTIDSYTGGGGFLDGSYINAHAREDSVEDRKKNSYFTNYVYGMVDSLIAPVFGDKITRTTDGELYRAFTENVDRRGTSLSDWLSNVAAYDALLGNVFIIMDNSSEPAGTIGEAVASRAYPYLYYRLPNEVEDVRLDQHGGISSITFRIDSLKVGGVSRNVYRTIEDGKVVDWYGKKNDKQYIGDHILSPSSRVIMTGSEVLPMPPFGGVAQTAKAIYNINSEDRDVTRAQGFGILQVPSAVPESSMVIGSKNVLYVDPEGTRDAKYVSPDSNVLLALQSNSKSVTDSMLASAVNAGVRVNSGDYKSGVAIMADNSPSYAVLSRRSEKFQTIEQKIHAMFCFMAGITDNSTVIYSKDYTPSTEKVKESQKIISEQMKLPYSAEQLSKLADYNMTLISQITGMPL